MGASECVNAGEFMELKTLGSVFSVGTEEHRTSPLEGYSSTMELSVEMIMT